MVVAGNTQNDANDDELSQLEFNRAHTEVNKTKRKFGEHIRWWIEGIGQTKKNQ